MKYEIPGNYQYLAINNGFFVQRNWHKNKLDLFNYLDLDRYGGILADIGCGSGNLIYRYSNNFKKAIGYDYSDECLKFVRGKLLEIGNSNSEVFKIDLSREINPSTLRCYKPADVGVCMEVLGHFKIDVAREIVIPNIARLIKKDGLLLVTTPNANSIWPLLEKLLDRFNMVPKLSGEQHFLQFTIDEISKALEKGGFKIVKIGTFNHFSPYVPLDLLRKAVLKLEVSSPPFFGPLIYALAKKIR